jgi:Zn finger protein HypA/HybF involved in hydrogenase expression
LFRRAKQPPDDLVAELLRTNLHRLECDACHAIGLVIVAADDAAGGESLGNDIGATEDFDDWQQAILCKVCHQPIPPERLEVFPSSRTCVGCQDLADRGQSPVEPEFCPKCGALLELRVSRGGGVTRYKQFCTGSPPCRL